MTTLEKVLDDVMELPLEQREVLVEILHNRYIVERRKSIAANAEISLALYRSGKLQPHNADETIAELRSFLQYEADVEGEEL